jgi:hypothetical protein
MEILVSVTPGRIRMHVTTVGHYGMFGHLECTELKRVDAGDFADRASHHGAQYVQVRSAGMQADMFAQSTAGACDSAVEQCKITRADGASIWVSVLKILLYS